MLDKTSKMGYNNQRCRERERAAAAVLENDIVKEEEGKNSQISERDNGSQGSESGTEDCEGLNIRV